ncbi:hypothetical protein ACWGE1_11995 [Streptomyces sp. NPDC054932]
MNMPVSAVARVASVLSAMALAGVCLGGCALLSPFTSCDGAEQDLKALSELAVLEARPTGAAPLKGAEEVYSECADDSGDAWMVAGRYYTAPGTPAEIADFYRSAAANDGWTLEHNPHEIPPWAADLCFNKGTQNRSRTLDLYFPPLNHLAEDFGYTPPAGGAPETVYRLEAGSPTDDTPTGCYD